MLQRIDKILSSQGICTRKQAKQLCKAGQVIVDGIAVVKPEQKVDPEQTTGRCQRKPGPQYPDSGGFGTGTPETAGPVSSGKTG